MRLHCGAVFASLTEGRCNLVGQFDGGSGAFKVLALDQVQDMALGIGPALRYFSATSRLSAAVSSCRSRDINSCISRDWEKVRRIGSIRIPEDGDDLGDIDVLAAAV